MTSKEALEEIKDYTLVTYDEDGEEEDCIRFGQLEPNLIEAIEKELKKPQELYNKIKDKRDIREEYIRKQDISDEDKSAICSEICAYNAVLLLMESMFEELENDK